MSNSRIFRLEHPMYASCGKDAKPFFVRKVGRHGGQSRALQIESSSSLGSIRSSVPVVYVFESIEKLPVGKFITLRIVEIFNWVSLILLARNQRTQNIAQASRSEDYFLPVRTGKTAGQCFSENIKQ